MAKYPRLRAACKVSLCALLLAAASAVRADSGEEDFFRLLSAYILAEEHGGYQAASAELVRLGVENRDPEILRDAAEYALRAGSMRLALKAGREWLQLENGKAPNKVVATVLLQAGHTVDAKPYLRKLVSEHGAAPGEYRELAAHVSAPAALADLAGFMGELYPPHKRDVEYYDSLSLLYEQAGDFARSTEAARAAADASPDAAHQLRHVRLLIDADYETALERLRGAVSEHTIEAGTLFGLLAQVQLSAHAQDSFDLMARVYPQQSADTADLYFLARMALFADEREVARSHAERAAAKDPHFIDAQFLLVFMLVRDGKASEALGMFERIADLRGETLEEVMMAYSYYSSGLTAEEASPSTSIPHSALSSYRAATVFEEMGELERALETFAQVREQDGYIHFYAQSSVALLQAKTGRTQQAYETIGELRERYTAEGMRRINQRDMVAETLLAEAELIKLDRGAGAALEMLERGRDQADDVRPILYQIAIYAEGLGDIALAERTLREYIRTPPSASAGLGTPDGYNALGYLLADKNLKLDEARSLIERALQGRPGDPNIIDSLGWVQYRQGNLEQARENLIRAARRSQAAEIHAHLGEVLWVLGERRGASAVWRRALYVHPENEVLLETVERFNAL